MIALDEYAVNPLWVTAYFFYKNLTSSNLKRGGKSYADRIY